MKLNLKRRLYAENRVADTYENNLNTFTTRHYKYKKKKTGGKMIQ